MAQEETKSTQVENDLVRAVQQLTNMLPWVPDNPRDQVGMMVAANQLQRIVTMLVAAPVSAKADFAAALPMLDRGVKRFQRLVNRFELSWLAMQGGPEPFDDEGYGQKIHGMGKDELIEELERLTSDDGEDALGELERLLEEGDENKAALSGRDLVRLKKMLRILIEILIRWKYPSADAIAKLIGKFLGHLDRFAKPKTLQGGDLPGMPGGEPGTPPPEPQKKHCLVVLRLLSITASDLGNTGNDDWKLDVTLAGQTAGFRGTFDQSKDPAQFPIADKKKEYLFSLDGCGNVSISIALRAEQHSSYTTSGFDDIGEELNYSFDFKCAHPLPPATDFKLDVHDDGDVRKKKSVLTFRFQVMEATCASY